MRNVCELLRHDIERLERERKALAPTPATALEHRSTGLMARTRILVVDDAQYSRELLRLHLSNAGYEVETAEDAIAAGKRVLEDPPHLIITDVNMPFMSGIEFVAALRADGGFPARENLDGEEHQLHAAAWLRKPVNAEHLLQVVALQVPG